MDAESRSRLGDLQSAVRKLGGREQLTAEERAELERLERELALEQQEKPDDPKTWLTDESRRPHLDGTDYNDRLKEICREELRGIARKFGEAAYEIAVTAVVTALKR